VRTVTVDRKRLLDRVLNFFQLKYTKDLRAARQKYRAAVQRRAEVIAKHAASKAALPKEGYQLGMNPPRDLSEEFDRVISQLEASTEASVTLQEDEFDRLWRGKWEFLYELREASMNYGKIARSSKF